MKKVGFRLLLIFVLTLSATFFTALMLKAAIGTYACWDALSVNVSQLTGLKVANFSMIMNVSCVFLQAPDTPQRLSALHASPDPLCDPVWDTGKFLLL